MSKEKERELVVDELPEQKVRSFKDEEGVNVKLITTNEAIQQILEKIRIIEKAVG